MDLIPIIDNVLSRKWLKLDVFNASYTPDNPKLCIVTGENASGKSLIRKSIQAYAKRKDILCQHFSMNSRTSSGIHRLMYGSEEDDSTGYNSVKTFLKALQPRPEPNCIVFDEPEIGCSLETQLALGQAIGEIENIGIFIITHSVQVVKGLLHLNPSHIHMGGEISLRDWVDRPIVPTDLKHLMDTSVQKWRAVESFIKTC